LKPTILTGLPLGRWAAPQKVKWAAEHFPGTPIITCERCGGAGSNDHIVPPAINKSNVRKYVDSSAAVTDYREFPNRTHHTVGQKGWEEVADFALQWAESHARGQVTLADVKAAFDPDVTFTTPPNPELRA